MASKEKCNYLSLSSKPCLGKEDKRISLSNSNIQLKCFLNKNKGKGKGGGGDGGGAGPH